MINTHEIPQSSSTVPVLNDGGKSRSKTYLGSRRNAATELEIPTATAAAIPTSDEAYRNIREKIIARGVGAAIPVAIALAEIHGYKNGLLWRHDFPTFEAYCRKRWDLSRSHSYRMVDYGNFIIELQNHSFSQRTIPTREAQVRPVFKLPKELRMDFWARFSQAHIGAVITANSVAGAVKQFSRERNLVAPPVRKIWAEKAREDFLRLKTSMSSEAVVRDPKMEHLMLELGKRLDEMINEARNGAVCQMAGECCTDISPAHTSTDV